jgi:hypothetical protein
MADGDAHSDEPLGPPTTRWSTERASEDAGEGLDDLAPPFVPGRSQPEPAPQEPAEPEAVEAEPSVSRETDIEEPVVEEPAVDEVEAEELVAESAAEESLAGAEDAEEPAADEPVAEEPVADTWAGEEPALEEPEAEERAEEDFPWATPDAAEDPVAEAGIAYADTAAEEPASEDPAEDEVAAFEAAIQEGTRDIDEQAFESASDEDDFPVDSFDLEGDGATSVAESGEAGEEEYEGGWSPADLYGDDFEDVTEEAVFDGEPDPWNQPVEAEPPEPDDWSEPETVDIEELEADGGTEPGIADEPWAAAPAPEPSRAAGTDAEELAAVLERLARLVREEGPEALRSEMNSADRFRAALAGLLAGYLAGS